MKRISVAAVLLCCFASLAVFTLPAASAPDAVLTDQAPAGERTAAAGAGSGTGATAPDTVPDRSLPDERYSALGLPPLDRRWTSRDLVRAVERLRTLAATNPEQLPRSGSAKSGKTFAHLAAAADAERLGDRSQPLSERMPEAIAYLGASHAVLKLYITAFSARQVGGDDMIELLGALLRTCAVMVALADELVPTIKKTDPRYEDRMAGLDRMRAGLAEVVRGAITSLTEDQVYSVAARGKLAGTCGETLPLVMHALPLADRMEVRRRLASLVTEPRLSALQPQLVALRDAVQAATKADDAQ